VILGIGCDLIEIDRITLAIDRFGDDFLERIFSPTEIEYCKAIAIPSIRFAGRFAAKEAIAKALACGIGIHLSWLDMEIRNNEQGKPYIVWPTGVADRFGVTHSHVSISHSKTMAMATVLLEG
jgi:holo-[acyl-carrier protein] synthase